MRHGIWVFVMLSALSLVAGCGRSEQTAASLPISMRELADSSTQTATPETIIDPTPVCPQARGVGTIAPAVSIYSIAFLVNGLEQVVYVNDKMQAAPGDEVQVREVIICADSFSGEGGNVCVDFAPVDQSDQQVMSEHRGTHLIPVTPGLTIISNVNFSWTISENWSGITAVLNHWTPENTQDLGCASGRCERDDWIIVDFR